MDVLFCENPLLTISTHLIILSLFVAGQRHMPRGDYVDIIHKNGNTAMESLSIRTGVIPIHHVIEYT